MRASLTVILCATLVTAAPQDDPLRTDRLATDDELVFEAAGVEAVDEEPGGHPIRSLVADDYRDLEFLRESLAGVRIVQLGESGHGMGEAFLLKSRLVRFLHRELGFTVLAFESDLYQCHDADRTAGSVPARTTLLRCVFGVWHTEEVLPLFEYLAGTRAGAEGAGPDGAGRGRGLRLAGFDIQPIGSNKEHRPGFLAALVDHVDAAYADSVRWLDSTLLVEYAKGGSSRRAYFREHRDALLSAYDGLASFLERHGPRIEAGAGREDALAGLQTVRSIAAYLRQQTAPDLRAYTEARDAGMAENVRFLLEELFPGERIVVWAHNAHVRHANQDIPVRGGYSPQVATRSMGSWLREWYGDELFTIGQYAFHGEAVNNSREVYAVEPAPRGTLENRLAEAGRRLWLIDLRALGSDPSVVWTRRPQIARYNGQVYQVLVPADQYDAVVLVAEVSPPRFLY